ncbi:MAG: hypothetical protein RLZZ129_1175 [Verrucomicrobiota bacterium]
MRRPSRVIVLDCGASHVSAAVLATDRAGRLTLERFALEIHGAESAVEEDWVQETGRALATLARRERLRGECRLAIPPHLALLRFARSPAVEPRRREEVIRFEAAQHIPYAPGEVVWDWVEVADDGMDFDFMLAAVKTAELTALCRVVSAAGFRPVQVLPAGLALLEARRLGSGHGLADTLWVDIGARSTQLLFVTGGRFYLRTLTLWAQAITQAVADEQRIGPVAAEAAKREVFGGETGVAVDSPVRDAVERATANFNLRMGLEVARALAAHAQQPGAVRPAVVQLTGGGAQTPGLIAALRDKLGLTVDLLGLPPGVQLAATAKADGADKAGVYLPVLVGLAAGATRTEGRTPNLLPPEWSEAGALRRAQRWWLAGAALLLLALVPPLWEAAGRRHTAKQEADRLERAMQPLRAQAAANAQILAELERMHEEGARLGRLVRAKSVWLDFFAELQSALFAVEDVWLDRLQLEQLPPGNMMAGAPDAPLRLAISGRLLDTRNPLAKVSPEANVRVRRLLAKIRESRFVAAVEDERFDATQPGILRFDVTLLLEPAEPL